MNPQYQTAWPPAGTKRVPRNANWAESSPPLFGPSGEPYTQPSQLMMELLDTILSTSGPERLVAIETLRYVAVAMDVRPPSPPELLTVPVRSFRLSRKVTCRMETDPEVVAQYCESMKRGVPFPPVIVARGKCSPSHRIVDGSHRLRAAQKVGVGTLDAILLHGCDNRTCRIVGLRANSLNGHRLSLATRLHHADRLLGSSLPSHESDEEIAALCGLDVDAVSGRRLALYARKVLGIVR
jgi:hypothetical protein